MQPAVQIAQGDVASFAIGLAGVGKHQRRVEIDLGRPFERELALFDVSLVLERIEANFNALECMYE